MNINSIPSVGSINSHISVAPASKPEGGEVPGAPEHDGDGDDAAATASAPAPRTSVYEGVDVKA
jgi:hypothetical protein